MTQRFGHEIKINKNYENFSETRTWNKARG